MSSLHLLLACELQFGRCDDDSINQTEEHRELSTLAVYFQLAILTAMSINHLLQLKALAKRV